jgi:hypothetical protein
LNNAGAGPVFRSKEPSRSSNLGASSSPLFENATVIKRRTLQAATETKRVTHGRPSSHTLFARSQNILDRFKMAFWAN